MTDRYNNSYCETFKVLIIVYYFLKIQVYEEIIYFSSNGAFCCDCCNGKLAAQ